MRTSRPFIHQWAYFKGSATHDLWPGDLAHVCGIYWYRFDGECWRVLLPEGDDGQ